MTWKSGKFLRDGFRECWPMKTRLHASQCVRKYYHVTKVWILLSFHQLSQWMGHGCRCSILEPNGNRLNGSTPTHRHRRNFGLPSALRNKDFVVAYFQVIPLLQQRFSSGQNKPLKKRLLRPYSRGISIVKNMYVYRVITLRNDCIFSFLGWVIFLINKETLDLECTTYYIMLRYVTLRYIILYYIILCYVMLCYVMLCYVILCYVMLC